MKLRPLPGYALIELEPLINPKLIILSDRSASMRGWIGNVHAIACSPTDRRAGYSDELVGQRVALRRVGGTPIMDNLHRFKVEDILYCIEGGTAVESVDPVMHRCRFCGDAKGSGQNVILVEHFGQSMCPRCGRNRYGEKIRTDAVPEVDREDMERFTRDLPERLRQKVV